MGFVKYLTLIVLIFMCLLTYLSVKPFQYFWSYLNFLQMLVYIGLIASPWPAQIHGMLAEMFPWVSLT